MKRHCVIGTLLAALTCIGSAQLSAQDSAPGDWQKVLDSDGVTVYDSVNNVAWLADFNLAAQIVPDEMPAPNNFRFGLPWCDVPNPLPADPCVNKSGTMTYTSAVKWVEGMNKDIPLVRPDMFKRVYRRVRFPVLDRWFRSLAPVGKGGSTRRKWDAAHQTGPGFGGFASYKFHSSLV